MSNPQHSTRVVGLGEGIAQAVCVCGWNSEQFGAQKRLGTMDALQEAADAADVHEWECSLADDAGPETE
jgi:hypothetical protein